MNNYLKRIDDQQNGVRNEMDQRKVPIRVGLPVTSGGAGFRVMLIQSDHDEYLVCKAIGKDGTATGPAVNVAKPLLARKSSYHGKTINSWAFTHVSPGVRTATNTQWTETEKFVPYWTDGATVKVVRVGKTGVTVDSKMLTLEALAEGRDWYVLTMAVTS